VSCRYDREKDAYLIDDEPCRHDQYGDPTYHCTARRTCSQHIGKDELTCARCLSRTRAAIRKIATHSALMLPAAIDDGVNSNAAALAGPAANPVHVDAIRFYVHGHATYLYRAGKISEQRLERILTDLPDEDDWHPYSVLTRWQMMLSEDYSHPLPDRLTITGAADYLDRNLHRVAHDREQDFALLAREMRRVSNRLEAALHNSQQAERGAPCPECVAAGGVDPAHVRLVRHYGHWCDDEDCEQVHYDDDSGDEWHCPRNKVQHRWTHAAYENYVEDREQAG
jgi:hypothetical protein